MSFILSHNFGPKAVYLGMLCALLSPIFSTDIPDKAYGAWQSETAPTEFIIFNMAGNVTYTCKDGMVPMALTEIEVKNKHMFCGITSDVPNAHKTCFKISGRQLMVTNGKTKQKYKFIGEGEREVLQICSQPH